MRRFGSSHTTKGVCAMFKAIRDYPANLYRYIRWDRHQSDQLKYEAGVLVLIMLMIILLGVAGYHLAN